MSVRLALEDALRRGEGPARLQVLIERIRGQPGPSPAEPCPRCVHNPAEAYKVAAYRLDIAREVFFDELDRLGVSDVADCSSYAAYAEAGVKSDEAWEAYARLDQDAVWDKYSDDLAKMMHGLG